MPSDALIESSLLVQNIRFDDVFYEVEGLKSCCHDRSGMLWVRYPHRKHKEIEEPILNERIAPSILAHFNVDIPKTMKEPFFSEAGE